MQIVIDIDDEDYKRIQDISDVFNSLTSRTYAAIRNGTQLPKGHGRLIDEKEISLSGIHFETELDHARMIRRLNTASTIIKADKAESEIEE